MPSQSKYPLFLYHQEFAPLAKAGFLRRAQNTQSEKKFKALLKVLLVHAYDREIYAATQMVITSQLIFHGLLQF